MLESVRTAVAALAAGQITEQEMPAPKIGESGVRKDSVRYAPSFIMGPDHDTGSAHAYTAATLGVFLGMADPLRGKEYRAKEKLRTAFDALELEEQGYLKKPETD